MTLEKVDLTQLHTGDVVCLETQLETTFPWMVVIRRYENDNGFTTISFARPHMYVHCFGDNERLNAPLVAIETFNVPFETDRTVQFEAEPKKSHLIYWRDDYADRRIPVVIVKEKTDVSKE